jgi:hypothetical protein
MPRAINPAVPEGVERVILKALAKEPENRYQTAGELARALAAAAAAGTAAPVRVVPGTLPMRPELEKPPVVSAGPRPRQGRRIPLWGWVAGGLIALCLIVGLLGGGSVLVPYLMRGAATATSVSAARPAATTAPGVTAIPGTSSPPEVVPPAWGTPVVETTGTPTGPLIRSFPAPAASPSGIARIGDDLLVLASGMLYRLDLEGNIQEETAFSGPCFGGAWDGQSLWCESGSSVYQLASPNWQEVSSFETELDGIVGPAWDGSALWVVDQSGNMIGYDRTGQRLRRLAVSAHTSIANLVGIEGEFWVVSVFNGVTRYDSQFNMVGSSNLEPCGASFPSALALFWDGESLWLANATDNRIYQCTPTD